MLAGGTAFLYCFVVFPAFVLSLFAHARSFDAFLLRMSKFALAHLLYGAFAVVRSLTSV